MIEADRHKRLPEDGLMWLGPAQEAQKDAKNLGQGKCQVHRHFCLFQFLIFKNYIYMYVLERETEKRDMRDMWKLQDTFGKSILLPP